MNLPNVYAYLDYRVFLRDWFDARKREDDSYSYAAFAKDGGCSKSALANVLSGARNPRSGTLDAFARAMGLSPSERNYLGLLVELAAAQDVQTRQAVMSRILAKEQYKQVRLAESEPEAAVFRYLEHWYLPATRELAMLPEFRADAAWVASMLQPPISEDQAAEALDTLFELDFLRWKDDGGVEPRDVRFGTEPETNHAAVMRFYQQEIPELLRKLRGDVPDEQHLGTLTVCLDPELMPELKARLTNLVQQIAAMGDTPGTDGPRRVYQLTVQLQPLSQIIG